MDVYTVVGASPPKTTTIPSWSRFIQAAITKHPSGPGMALALTSTL